MRRLPRWRFRIRPAMRRRIGRVWLDRASYDAFPAAWAVDHHVEEPRDENVATRDGGKSDHRRHAHMMAEATKPHKTSAWRRCYPHSPAKPKAHGPVSP
jgi:hypothetical protein